MKKSYILLIVAFFLIVCNNESAWSVTKRNNTIEIAYGCGTDFVQYAVIHLESSYFRMNYGPESGWGTSIVLLPSFWENGYLYQGASISVTWDTVGSNLIISFTGSISSLDIHGEVSIEHPDQDLLEATVTINNIEGDVTLDDRPWEAFKLVMLSSMYISDTIWDAHSAYVDSQIFEFPHEGWIIEPPVEGITFGLKGGSSTWKTNAPTIEITLEQPRSITGWVTASTDPNDDNIGLWAASDQVIRSWQYTAVAKP